MVPKTISSKLTNITDQAVEPFKTIFSTSDIPVEHPVLRSKFRENKNYGTLLRWECAISEMKLLSFYGEDMVTTAVDRWNAFVISQLFFPTVAQDTGRVDISVLRFVPHALQQ